MKIVNRKLDEIQPYENNPRRNDQAVDAVATSIEQFGFRLTTIGRTLHQRRWVMSDIDDILGIDDAPQRQKRNQAPPIPLGHGPIHARKPTRRVFHNALRTRKAAEALPRLPTPGETMHVIMTGAYDAFDLVDAILTLAGPTTIDTLHLATLGFNSANADRLIQMHDAGQVGRCTMIVSMYYEADHKEKDTCYRLATELTKRGGWYVACRSHCKVIAAKMTDGRCFTIESSANLRTCRNLEQFIITHDEALFHFHRSWMTEVRDVERQRAKPAN